MISRKYTYRLITRHFNQPSPSLIPSTHLSHPSEHHSARKAVPSFLLSLSHSILQAAILINLTFVVKHVASPGFHQTSYSAGFPKTKTFGVIAFGNEYNYGTEHEVYKNNIPTRLGLWMIAAAQWSDKLRALRFGVEQHLPGFWHFP